MPALETPSPSSPFEPTRWSIVLAAREGRNTSGARQALGKLCAAYWYPLYAFVRRTGKSAHDAEDLTQEFFTRLLEKNGMEGVDPEKGKFRSFLLGALKHFLANEWHRAQRVKRGGGVTFLPLDSLGAETRYAGEPADTLNPEMIFDRRWALTLIEHALERLRQEFAAKGETEIFEALKSTLNGAEPPREELATRLGLTEGALKVAVHRLRRQYREILRAEIAETVDTPADVDDEMRHLVAVLRAG